MAATLMASCMVPVAQTVSKAPVSLKAQPVAAKLPNVSNRTIKKTSCMQVRAVPFPVVLSSPHCTQPHFLFWRP